LLRLRVFWSVLIVHNIIVAVRESRQRFGGNTFSVFRFTSFVFCPVFCTKGMMTDLHTFLVFPSFDAFRLEHKFRCGSEHSWGGRREARNYGKSDVLHKKMIARQKSEQARS
jgi:hypothetical protein